MTTYTVGYRSPIPTTDGTDAGHTTQYEEVTADTDAQAAQLVINRHHGAKLVSVTPHG